MADPEIRKEESCGFAMVTKKRLNKDPIHRIRRAWSNLLHWFRHVLK